MQLKLLKLKKKHYTDLPLLLKEAGLVSSDGKEAYPERIFISLEDDKLMKQELYKAYKKKFPFLNKIRIQVAVNMEILNLGPNTNLGVAVKKGYAIVLESENGKA